MKRLLSYTEIEAAMTCWAKWDFAYGGRLAGSTLKPKTILPILSEGRAWGAAVAAWHAHGGELLAAWEAHSALLRSISGDVEKMREAGVPVDIEAVGAMQERMGAVLDHYMETAPPLGGKLTLLEGEFITGVPSRGGKRASSRYDFHSYVDGYLEDRAGYAWLVEFKFRGDLTPVELIAKQRQHRWYAWTFEQHTGRPLAGVLVDERLNEAPKPPRIVKAKRKGEGIDGRMVSHAKDQITTPKWYAEVCREFNVEPDMDTYNQLAMRRWQQRVPLTFRASEMAAAGAELTSAGKLIGHLDSGDFTPVRNAQKTLCSMCKFKQVCPEPGDTMLVESLFSRGTPKRLKDPATRNGANGSG